MATPPLARPWLEAWTSRLPTPGAGRRPSRAEAPPLRLVEPPVAETPASEPSTPPSDTLWIEESVTLAAPSPPPRHARLGARTLTLDPVSAERAERQLRRHFQDRARFRVR